MAEQVAFLYPAVRESRLQTYANHMFDETVAYIDDWGEEGEIDLLDTMNSLTVNVACRCLLGPEIRDQLYGGFDRLYHDLQRGINLIGFFFPAPVDAGTPPPRQGPTQGGRIDRWNSCRTSTSWARS